MNESERCPECGSWGEECAFPTAQPTCGCARCLRAQRDSAQKQAHDLTKILIREGGVEGAYERRLAEALRERDETRACLAFERVTVAELKAEVDRLKELLEWTDGISKASQERHKELALEIGDAIEAMRVRGAEVEDASGRMTLLEVVGKVMHDLFSARSALKDYKEGYERLQRERDEARAEVKELREVLKTAGDRLRACSYELTEFSYQELASVLFDLPLVTEGDK